MSDNQVIVSCDPGLSGAFAFMGAGVTGVGVTPTIDDMPTYERAIRGKKRTTLDEFGVIEYFRKAALFDVEILVIEQVGGVQGQSASAGFNFGYGVGVVTTAARMNGMTIERVAANVWKKALHCPSDKESARIRACELMPQWAHLWPRKGDHGRAEAAMIGYWWLNK